MSCELGPERSPPGEAQGQPNDGRSLLGDALLQRAAEGLTPFTEVGTSGIRDVVMTSGIEGRSELLEIRREEPDPTLVDISQVYQINPKFRPNMTSGAPKSAKD